MNHDIKTIEKRMKVTKDTDALVALTILRDVLVAWKQAKYFDDHMDALEFKRLLKGA